MLRSKQHFAPSADRRPVFTRGAARDRRERSKGGALQHAVLQLNPLQVQTAQARLGLIKLA